MSTSLLYHGFGVVGYRYVRHEFQDGQVIFHIERPRDRLRCPHCGSAAVWAQGTIERTFRTVPIGSKPVQLRLPVPRVLCFGCGRVRQMTLGFADPKKHDTRSLERYALDLSRHMTIRDVAAHLRMSWDTIKGIQARALRRRFGTPKLHAVRQLAIDEIAIGHGHRYLTVVLNLLTGAVVFVGDGRGADALAAFWPRLRRARAAVEAVATDLSPADIRAVRDHLPWAVHVVDHFHVIKLFNDKLTAFRRELYHQAAGDRERRVLKGTRWLLLKNPENLAADRDERRRLAAALRLNAPLAAAYYLKDDLRQIWDQPDRRTAGRVFDDWLARARASGIRMLVRFAATLAEHREGILNYYLYPISTGPLEGTNTTIRLLNRQAYGFRDPEFFKLKILGLHETKHALVG